MKVVSTIVNAMDVTIKDVSADTLIGVVANIAEWMTNDVGYDRQIRGLFDAHDAVRKYGLSLKQRVVEG